MSDFGVLEQARDEAHRDKIAKFKKDESYEAIYINRLEAHVLELDRSLANHFETARRVRAELRAVAMLLGITEDTEHCDALVATRRIVKELEWQKEECAKAMAKRPADEAHL